MAVTLEFRKTAGLFIIFTRGFRITKNSWLTSKTNSTFNFKPLKIFYIFQEQKIYQKIRFRIF